MKYLCTALRRAHNRLCIGFTSLAKLTSSSPQTNIATFSRSLTSYCFLRLKRIFSAYLTIYCRTLEIPALSALSPSRSYPSNYRHSPSIHNLFLVYKLFSHPILEFLNVIRDICFISSRAMRFYFYA
jgi:hypothetical protein